jgi:hypothetical protein
VRKSRKKRKGRPGWGFLFATGLFACLLLLFNGAVTAALYNNFLAIGPRAMENSKVEQFVLFVGPITLLFIEWWIADFAIDRWRVFRSRR